MSDVWQGPGWWLASDGKWYPADAEPGAIYDGDLTTEDSPSIDAPPPVALSTQTVVSEPVAPIAPEPVVPITNPVVEQAPVVEQTPVVEHTADSMPQPIVETSGAGWQAIGEVAEPAPEPDLETEAFQTPEIAQDLTDDGWTSAFEERQSMGAVTTTPSQTPVTPAPAPAPAVDAQPPAGAETVLSQPDIGVPSSAQPATPTVETAIPNVTAPDVTAPDVSAPEVSVPEVTAPNFATPAVSAPEVTVPEVSVPEVSVPEVATAAVSAPEVTVPEVTVPNVTVPEVTVPQVTVPEATVPDTNLRQPAAPIERQDAWRKPLAPDIEPARTEVTAPRGTPEVVDLAIPQDAPPQEIEPPARNWRMWGGILLMLAMLGLIAWFIAMLFSGNDATDTVDNTTSSAAVAVGEPDSSAAPSTDEAGEGGTGTVAPDATSDTEAPDSTGSQQASVFELRAGDCIVGDIGAGQVTKVEKVDCEVAHQFEVYREALIESSITTFDEAAISAYAEEVCRTSLAAYIPADDDRNLKFKFLQPTEDSWNQPEDPDRVITCLLFDGDGDPLIGRAN